MIEQSNIEIRWYKATKDSVPVLQYRKYYNSAKYAGNQFGIPVPENWKWSAWVNVETFTEKY